VQSLYTNCFSNTPAERGYSKLKEEKTPYDMIHAALLDNPPLP